MSHQIIPLRAFSDNYIWTLRDDTHAIVVDPGDAARSGAEPRLHEAGKG